jgi:hypothetical protein
MKLYTYVITRDYGFAPNPFGGYCTLATCKPLLRKVASVGDWVIATGPKTSYNKPGYLFFAMRVDEKITFNEYWDDGRFQYKKPLFNGSLKQCFGDNIYFFNANSNEWHQQDSHHSYENGNINYTNLKKDTKFPYALISKQFYYFGKSNIMIPSVLKEKVCHNQRVPTFKKVEEKFAINFLKWLENNYSIGIVNDPMEFDKGFKRYSGN